MQRPGRQALEIGLLLRDESHVLEGFHKPAPQPDDPVRIRQGTEWTPKVTDQSMYGIRDCLRAVKAYGNGAFVVLKVYL